MLKIVGYHYVNDNNTSIFKNLKSLSIKDFKDQIRYIKKNYNIISLEELLHLKKIPNRSALLTFDDGYLDHYKNVFPILYKEKISGIFFSPDVALNQNDILDVNKIQIFLHMYNDKKKLFNEVCKQIEYHQLDVKHFLKLIKKFSKSYDLRWHDKYSNNVRNLLQYILPKQIRKKIINKILNKNLHLDKKKIIKKMYLNKKQAKEMIKHGMFFGSHGSNHEWLEYMSYRQQYDDIKNSKNNILQLGVKSEHLTICYPYGSYNSDTIKIVKKLKFKYGFANYSQNVINLKKQRFFLPRIDTNEF
jgi:peptidoglycan/xylan/chitin deacetylase (PgdA/CDA1 family)